GRHPRGSVTREGNGSKNMLKSSVKNLARRFGYDVRKLQQRENDSLEQSNGALDRGALIAFYREALELARDLRLRELRQLEYDTFGPSSEFLLANVGPEKFVVQANDKFISRGLYADGEFDLDKLATVLRISGRNFKVLVDVGANIGSICIPAVK